MCFIKLSTVFSLPLSPGPVAVRLQVCWCGDRGSAQGLGRFPEPLGDVGGSSRQQHPHVPSPGSPCTGQEGHGSFPKVTRS